MEDKEDVVYDQELTLPDNAFTKDGFVFLGWSRSSTGNVEFQDKQLVKNLTEGEDVTLYAVWAKDLYNVTGKIKSPEDGNITLELRQGNNVYGQPTTVTPYTADTEKDFAWNGIPAGTYNLIATQGDKTMTVAVVITDEHVVLDLITMPRGKVSSVVDVKSVDTPAIVVGGLDEAAAAEEVENRKVTVTIAVEAQNEADAGEAGEAILEESRARNAEFIDFTVTKTITNKGIEESVETMTETKNPIELVIPFNFSGKSGIRLYRYHNGVEELKQAKDNEILDGTYKIDQKNGVIYVYTNRFSTYAIVYNNVTSLIIFTKNVVKETEHGVVTVDPEDVQTGDEIVVTATPDEGYKLGELKVRNAEGEAGTANPFTDVAEGAYYYDAVLWAVENGVTNGTSDTTFSPANACLRAQIVTFLYRAYNEEK